MGKYKIIYLEPICECRDGKLFDRQWCEDDVWTGPCEECGEQVVALQYLLCATKELVEENLKALID